MKQECCKKESKAGFVLGILSICLFFLTWPSIILGVVGLCLVKKDSKTRVRDRTLNIVGIVMSFIYTYFIYYLIFSGMLVRGMFG